MDKEDLLDIIYKDNIIFVSYSEDRSSGNSSTSVAKAEFNKKNLNFKNIFQSRTSNKLWLSFWIKNDY